MTEPKPNDPGRRAGWAAPLKPMARAIRISLFEREVRERLASAALDVVFASAECMSEGQRERRDGRDAYFGSTMLTVDLAGLAGVLRDACDAGTARRLAVLLEADPSVAARVQEIARGEVERVSRARPARVVTELRVRAQGAKVFLDVDVEAGF